MNKIRGFFKRKISGIVAAVGGIATMVATGAGSVYASGDTSSVTAPLANLLRVFESVIAGIGAIILLKNIVEAVQAYQQQDSSGMYSALKGVVAGAIMCAAGLVLAIIGIPGAS